MVPRVQFDCGRVIMSAKIFLSIVSDEFRAYRDQLRADLTRHNVEVKVQEDFKDLGGDTLDKLDVYIAHCDGVVHLAGDMTGSAPGESALGALRAKYPDLAVKLPPLGDALRNGSGVSCTQWEAWLALYHGKPLFIAKATDSAERGPKYTPRTPRVRRKPRIWRVSKRWTAIRAALSPVRIILPSTYCLPPFSICW